MRIFLYRLQQCRVPYLYRNVMKQLHVHSAVQYCISVKDKNTYLSKVYLKI